MRWFAISLLCLMPIVALGAPIDELQKKITDKESEIKRLEAEIAGFQTSLEKQSKFSSTLKGEVTKLETQIKKLNADILLTRHQVQATKLRMKELGMAIDTKEKKIVNDHRILTELVQSQQELDDVSLLEMLLARDSLADFFDEQEKTLSIEKNIIIKLEELRNDKTLLTQEHEKRNAEKQKLVAFEGDLANNKKIQEGTVSSKNTLLKDSKNQETRYQALLKERARKRELIQQEIQNIEDELRKTIDPNSIPAKRPGVLSWPTEPHYITQDFGFTEFATTYGSDAYRGKGHNGIDLRASLGTRVLAAADGVVKDFGNTDILCSGGSYGKWIVVEHTGNLTTLYAHLSTINVTRGQKVARGDIIAYSGDTGYVTGPHLHFTVYASNTYQYGKTRHCGLVPTGGYLNPRDYL